jgi:hypothetical protein
MPDSFAACLPLRAGPPAAPPALAVAPPTARARMTQSGLRLQPGLPFAEWTEVGRRIASLAHASAWSLGDWLVYGEHAYGRRYAGALEVTGFDYQTLRNYAWVARAFDRPRRRDALSFGHHAELAALPEPAQELWLTRAESAGWSRNELRRHLRPARRAASEEPSLVVRMSVRPDQEQRWRVAADARRLDLAQWLAATADAAAAATLDDPLRVMR